MTIAEAHSAVVDAVMECRLADERYNDAYKARTAAVNRLNMAQKAFDEEVALLRHEAAVSSSDWWREKNQRPA